MRSSKTFLLAFLAFLGALVGGFVYGGKLIQKDIEYNSHSASTTEHLPPLTGTTSAALPALTQQAKPVQTVTHITTPVPLRAAYMTSCIASGRKLRAPLVAFVEDTLLNALVVDIKDFSGMVSIDTGDPRFVLNSHGCNVPDIQAFISSLHEKGIYVIGRVTVMQDQVYTKTHPDAAVKRKSDGETWHDRKGLAFVDPGASEYWQYMIDLGKASYAIGFDEINYDYIRFPSDGDMANAKFTRTGSSTKAEMMKRFYTALGVGMHEAKIPISADLFGMTTTNTDDLGIGQVLENALLNFDYVAPMVYPSHYPPYWNGWKNPNLVPYEVVKYAMSHAVVRANALEQKESGFVASVSTTTTKEGKVATTTSKFIRKGIYAKKLRPWIQDFNYGKVYTEADVRAQMKAVYDSGLDSWMMWDPKNVYTKSAYDVATQNNINTFATTTN